MSRKEKVEQILRLVMGGDLEDAVVLGSALLGTVDHMYGRATAVRIAQVLLTATKQAEPPARETMAPSPDH